MQINLTSASISTYRDLMRTIQQILYTSWGKDKIRFTSAYPKQTEGADIKPPLITYTVVSKKPGAFKNQTEIKPRHREYIKIEDENGAEMTIELVGQMFDYLILFEVWAEDGDSADELVERFQHFMTQYTGYLKKVGVSEIIFNQMDGETGGPQWRTDLIKRNLVYQVRLDEVAGINSPVIEDITVDAIVHQTNYEMVLDILTRDDS